MPPVSTTPCPACSESIIYDPTSPAPYAACRACGKLARLPETQSAAGLGGMRVIVNGRPVTTAGFRPSPLAFVAITLAVAAGVALAVVVVAIAFGLFLVAAAALLAAAAVRYARRALPRGRRGTDTSLRLPTITVGLLFVAGCSDRDAARKELAAVQAEAVAAEKQKAELGR